MDAFSVLAAALAEVRRVAGVEYADARAVELDHILLRVSLLAQTRGIAVDADAARRDQLLRLAAGDTCAARQNFLQSFFHAILLFCG